MKDTIERLESMLRQAKFAYEHDQTPDNYKEGIGKDIRALIKAIKVLEEQSK